MVEQMKAAALMQHVRHLDPTRISPERAIEMATINGAKALGLEAGDYFEYMLTRFTEPSEIIGPIDINQLRDGRYIRREQGKLPTARLAFLDEIFKSNSAILNILLTIINEWN